MRLRRNTIKKLAGRGVLFIISILGIPLLVSGAFGQTCQKLLPPTAVTADGASSLEGGCGGYSGTRNGPDCTGFPRDCNF